MRVFCFILFLLCSGCDVDPPPVHQPGNGAFPGIPSPIENLEKDVVEIEDEGSVFLLDSESIAPLADVMDSNVKLKLRLIDPRDNKPHFGLSLLVPGSTGKTDVNGEIDVEIDANMAFSMGCSGTGFAPTWLAGTMGANPTTLDLAMVSKAAHEQLLGAIGLQQNAAKASLLVRVTDKNGNGVSGAYLTRSPQSGAAFLVTGPLGVLGDTISSSDMRVIGLANIDPGTVTLSVFKNDGTECSVQPGGGAQISLVLSMGAAGSVSFLCP